MIILGCNYTISNTCITSYMPKDSAPVNKEKNEIKKKNSDNRSRRSNTSNKN